MFKLFRADDSKEQAAAVNWLRACIIAESGPAFMHEDRRKCRLLLAYIERLESRAPETEGASNER